MAAPTEKYENYVTGVCWNLSSTAAAQNFIRSEFDFGARQRRAISGYDVQSMKIVVNSTELADFKTFWAAINDGTDKFYTDQSIAQDDTINKIARYTQAYKVIEFGGGTYEIVTSVELIQTGTPAP